MRATRALLRRRRHLTRQRAEWRAHSQQTTSQYNLPEIGTKLAAKANRDGVAERCPASAVQQRIDVDLTRLDASDRLLTDLELALVRTAKAHEAQPCSRLRSVPGVGKIRALVLLDESHAIQRFPRRQQCVSDGRLGKCATDSAGTRHGPSGTTIGTAALTWACAEAAGRFLRHNPAGQKDRARRVNNPGQGPALTALAPKRARAVYDRWTRDTAFDRDKFFNADWSGAREPAASRAAAGISLAIEGWGR
jgi:transposase